MEKRSQKSGVRSQKIEYRRPGGNEKQNTGVRRKEYL
jgi:hypothetical protein